METEVVSAVAKVGMAVTTVPNENAAVKKAATAAAVLATEVARAVGVAAVAAMDQAEDEMDAAGASCHTIIFSSTRERRKATCREKDAFHISVHTQSAEHGSSDSL